MGEGRGRARERRGVHPVPRGPWPRLLLLKIHYKTNVFCIADLYTFPKHTFFQKNIWTESGPTNFAKQKVFELVNGKQSQNKGF